mgnify:FL=1
MYILLYKHYSNGTWKKVSEKKYYYYEIKKIISLLEKMSPAWNYKFKSI